MFHVILLLHMYLEALSPSLSPTAILLSENGSVPEEMLVLESGEEYTGAAPLEFRFTAGNEGAGIFRYEWEFAHDVSYQDIFLKRFEEETIYTFQESGTCYIRLWVTDVDTEETVEGGTFVIHVTESNLEVPNAFSPNNDGVNDVFLVKHKSLIQFDATVFNRWGKEIYHWGLDNIDRGWDGTSRGKQVPEGVYFIVIKAKGSDGVIYDIKSDINILR